uniref:Glyoxalase domain-containing protein 4 n=1 Tax=Aceria tosichella TaxID=561515 RepID=A0A6G1S8D0_9ACAR
MSASSRALHYVLKVGDLKKNIEFFRDKLAMRVLRHEVFDEGCEAACNGPYDNKWSKTMIGYGPEDDHFVLELTYNYSVGSYKLGNDLQYLKISLKPDLFDKVLSTTNEQVSSGESRNFSLKSPDGYRFLIETGRGQSKNDVTEVCLSCTNLNRSKQYWTELLKMTPAEEDQSSRESSSNETVLSYSSNSSNTEQQARLRLCQINTALDHASAYGRIAFACPSADLRGIQAAVEAANEKVLTPFLSLDTPGKATVQVVILADPDGHEICFVGDEGFRELSQVDPEANTLIEKSMADDKSNEWFEKKGKSKSDA